MARAVRLEGQDVFALRKILHSTKNHSERVNHSERPAGAKNPDDLRCIDPDVTLWILRRFTPQKGAAFLRMVIPSAVEGSEDYVLARGSTNSFFLRSTMQAEGPFYTQTSNEAARDYPSTPRKPEKIKPHSEKITHRFVLG